jgi:hypothetical protein
MPRFSKIEWPTFDYSCNEKKKCTRNFSIKFFPTFNDVPTGSTLIEIQLLESAMSFTLNLVQGALVTGVSVYVEIASVGMLQCGWLPPQQILELAVGLRVDLRPVRVNRPGEHRHDRHVQAGGGQKSKAAGKGTSLQKRWCEQATICQISYTKELLDFLQQWELRG